jgi:hypothetical protein
MPIVEMDHVDPLPLRGHRPEGGRREQPEAPGVVGIAVQLAALEGSRVIDQAESIAAPVDIDDRDLRRPRCRGRIGDADRAGGGRSRRDRDGGVAREEDVDGSLEPPDRTDGPAEGVDDVAETARLGPRLAFGGDRDDPHRWHAGEPSAASVGRTVGRSGG